MARDFYACFPFDLPCLPSVRRIRRRHGAGGVCMYYELRIMVAAAHQYGQPVGVEDILDSCCDWGMNDDQAAECLRDMAELRMVEPDALEAGVIEIADVAARAEYLKTRSECGRKGGRPPKAKS